MKTQWLRCSWDMKLPEREADSFYHMICLDITDRQALYPSHTIRCISRSP